ncbi:MAG: dTDP-4-dehydrorhamnose reductase [Candidatus Zixiibacteriota bacterium]
MAAHGRILITGYRGQLGSDLMLGLAKRYQVSGFDLPEVDIRELRAVLDIVRESRPDIVIHAAAYTDVDGCESDHDLAFAVNRDGTWNVAQACEDIGARMIYYSTDYVFDGRKATAYVESDPPHPATVYGRSKLEGENAVRETVREWAVLRIAWVYGRQGKNFVKTMIRLGQQQLAVDVDERKSLTVVDDQYGNPTWTVDIVRQTEEVIEHDLRGVFHATSEGEVSWYRFACDIFEELKMKVVVEPCTTRDYPRPAPRPARSSLENQRLKAAGRNVMRDYREALREFLQLHGRELLNEV